MLRRSMMKNEEEEMGWKEVKTVYAENDGGILFVDGFEAERIRITECLELYQIIQESDFQYHPMNMINVVM